MKAFKFILTFLCIMIIFGCNDNKKKTSTIEVLSDSTEIDSTIYGRCGDGTSKHTFELENYQQEYY